MLSSSGVEPRENPVAQDKREERVVELYDPHPGTCSLAGPIPREIKQLADQMSGKRIMLSELEHVVERLQEATEGTVSIKWQYSYIGLKVGEKFWRVLRYK